ncbi:hypothetical protein [Acinetobacter sp. B51(2017)]|uniref:hypothetical protein n=1 Tax=Acinetobacter sp. B51(2017) TaxID=2060938 RepID=UPI000F07A2E5|nr:hypothetical protein [Acinetobacter sp. B51(2017)]
MPHILTLVAAVAAVLALIVFSFQQEQVPRQLQQNTAVSTEQSAQQPETAASRPSPTTQTSHNKSSKLSATASAYYQQAYEHGYASLVAAFESGAIANSDMSQKEKQKICELTLSRVHVAELKRLEHTECQVQNGKISFMSVNSGLKTPDGKIDQAAIIEKLAYLREHQQLQTDVTHTIAGLEYKEQDSLYSSVVGFDLDQVFDYLLSIDAPLPAYNLLNDHLRGHHPNLNMIKKLQQLGYSADQMSLKIINDVEYQQKRPEIYQYLNKSN